MKERTMLILSALIKDFIETANPVASKHLLETCDLDISSATVRNEFAALEEVGLIASPHVSAGKVPTEKGYRFFVDQLMTNEEKNEKLIREIFEKHIENYKLSKAKESIFDAMKLVSQLSNNVAFATLDNDRTFYLGLSNVLRSPEFITNPEKGAQVVEVFEGREKFREMLKNMQLGENDVRIFIGEENIMKEINSCAIIVGKFRGKSASGYIGILGPMRMKYGYNRALVRNVLEMVL
jgi:transcriptional regulator of heat shock response